MPIENILLVLSLLTLKFSVPPIIYEFILFVLGMIKFYQAAKAGWGTESVVRRFLRDGVWAFVVPFGVFNSSEHCRQLTSCLACLLTNTIFVLFVTGGLSSAGYTWVAPVACFTVSSAWLSKMILEHVSDISPNSQHELPTDRRTGHNKT